MTVDPKRLLEKIAFEKVYVPQAAQTAFLEEADAAFDAELEKEAFLGAALGGAARLAKGGGNLLSKGLGAAKQGLGYGNTVATKRLYGMTGAQKPGFLSSLGQKLGLGGGPTAPGSAASAMAKSRQMNFLRGTGARGVGNTLSKGGAPKQLPGAGGDVMQNLQQLGQKGKQWWGGLSSNQQLGTLAGVGAGGYLVGNQR